MACHHRSPDRDRRYLRDELQEHAGTAMGIWLFHRRRTDLNYLCDAVLAVPARRMVVRRGAPIPCRHWPVLISARTNRFALFVTFSSSKHSISVERVEA